MAKIAVGEINIDRCTSCGGLWLDALEKEKLLATRGAAQAVDTVPAPAIPPHPSGLMLCPRDRSMLIRLVDQRQPHVRFESCTVCGGTFLDAGELKDLSEFTLAERLKAMF